METRQKEIYDYLQNNPEAKSADIKKALGLNDNSLRYHLMELQKEGMIKWR
jgi:predicted transcriptional regulator